MNPKEQEILEKIAYWNTVDSVRNYTGVSPQGLAKVLCELEEKIDRKADIPIVRQGNGVVRDPYLTALDDVGKEAQDDYELVGILHVLDTLRKKHKE